jgi:hypothetical protein
MRPCWFNDNILNALPDQPCVAFHQTGHKSANIPPLTDGRLQAYCRWEDCPRLFRPHYKTGMHNNPDDPVPQGNQFNIQRLVTSNQTRPAKK